MSPVNRIIISIIYELLLIRKHHPILLPSPTHLKIILHKTPRTPILRNIFNHLRHILPRKTRLKITI